jgi:hypothetical protein
MFFPHTGRPNFEPIFKEIRKTWKVLKCGAGE